MYSQQTLQTGCALVQPLSHDVRPEDEIETFDTFDEPETVISPSQTYSFGSRITYIDRAIIRRYFEEHSGQLAVGFNGARSTGHSKSMPSWIPGTALPANLQVRHLPPGLEYKLSTLKIGYERVLVGNDVLLIETPKRIVVDEMQNSGAVHVPVNAQAKAAWLTQ